MQKRTRQALSGLMLWCLSGQGAPLRLAYADVPPQPEGPTPAGPAGPGTPGEVRFEFEQLKAGGVVRCALYASSGDYLKKSLREVMGTVRGGQALCVFANVAPGTYAMAAFHDANSNGQLDTGIFGIPIEGVCTSNNAKGRFGPPKYKDAAFPFKGGGSATQALRMYYR